MEINPIQAAQALTAQLNLDVQNANVQQQISKLPISQILMGAVAGNDKNGNMIIRLAGNDLLLSSPIALAKNAQVALKVENVSGSMVATLLSVDGKLPPSQPQKVTYQSQPNPEQQKGQPQPQPQNQTSQTVAQNPTLKIISILPQGTGKVAEPITFPLNTNIIADTVELSSAPTSPLSAIIIAPAPEIIQAIRAKLGLKSENVTAGTELEESLPDEIKPGTNLKLKITATDSPQPQPAKPQIATDNRVLGKQEFMSEPENDLQSKVQNFTPSLKATNTGNLALSGIVLHGETNGEILLQTALGKVLVNGGAKYSTLEKGSVVNLEISEITPPAITDEAPADDSPITTLTKQWPALQALEQHANTPGLMTKLAGIESGFAARLDGFVNAVKSGNIKDWLGNNYFDELEASDDGKSIINKLKGDLTTLRDNFNNTNQAGWQTMLFPVFDGQQLQQARLHVKYLPDENNKPSPTAGTRFLVEIDTSHFGEIQMDGLVRANVAKHFDLMIRTHDPLDLTIKQDIHTIFNDAAELTGFKGNIEFSVMREFPASILGQTTAQNLNAKIDHKDIEA